METQLAYTLRDEETLDDVVITQLFVNGVAEDSENETVKSRRKKANTKERHDLKANGFGVVKRNEKKLVGPQRAAAKKQKIENRKNDPHGSGSECDTPTDGTSALDDSSENSSVHSGDAHAADISRRKAAQLNKNKKKKRRQTKDDK